MVEPYQAFFRDFVVNVASAGCEVVLVVKCGVKNAEEGCVVAVSPLWFARG